MDPARAAAPATMPVVVTAVQVYDAGDEADLVAYRWRITPTLTKGDDGTWVVSG